MVVSPTCLAISRKWMGDLARDAEELVADFALVGFALEDVLTIAFGSRLLAVGDI